MGRIDSCQAKKCLGCVVWSHIASNNLCCKPHGKEVVTIKKPFVHLCLRSFTAGWTKAWRLPKSTPFCFLAMLSPLPFQFCPSSSFHLPSCPLSYWYAFKIDQHLGRGTCKRFSPIWSVWTTQLRRKQDLPRKQDYSRFFFLLQCCSHKSCQYQKLSSFSYSFSCFPSRN